MKLWKKVHTRIDYRLRSLSPERLAARRDGPTVVANGIPKSGTHLLVRCLTLFPALSYSGLHYTSGTPDRAVIERFLRRTGKGRFMAAHLYWSDECARLFEEKGVRHILMIRDPRDVIVSSIFFFLKRKDPFWHPPLSSEKNMDARVRLCITGADGGGVGGARVPSIANRYACYTPWMERDDCLVVRFEDMIGPNGGGDAEIQRRDIRRIAGHVGQSLTDEMIERVAQGTFSTKTVTFRKGVIGNWREHFSPENERLFAELHGDLMKRIGYALDG